eukprot:TRINITY_DN8422_c0_g1_i4.p1 TRINITY_DN8422_c0_g1~~TRINITY_DN8422_c0_g1_i4.p1  ORF type:complete len:290 (+),score=49.84 TRINITY_DN8422_c0_g1_i4:141-1010(+)
MSRQRQQNPRTRSSRDAAADSYYARISRAERRGYGAVGSEPKVRIATNKYTVIDDYEAPNSFSADDKMMSVSSVLQAAIVDSIRNPDRPIYAQMEDPYYQNPNDVSFLCFVCHRENNEPDAPPTQTEIFQFIKMIIKTTRMSYDVSIVGLILVERFLKRANIVLSVSNWKPIVLSSLIVACKTWGDDEVRFCNADMTRTHKITDFSLKQINKFEKYFLEVIQFDVSVTSALYSHYYFGIIGKTNQSESNNFRTKYYGRPNMAENIAGGPKFGVIKEAWHLCQSSLCSHF